MVVSALYPHFCRKMQALAPAGRWFVAFSGGLDSTVLLALCARLAAGQGRALTALHVHHGLQAVADAWPAHCAAVASRLGVPCRTLYVQVALGPRISLEAAAREARYRALAAELAPGDALLTGHHRDDQAETLLLALKRGAGVAGLAAMPASRPLGAGVQLRPLLDCSRQQLEAHAREAGLSWVEDPSNADNRFDRNFLRNEILPRLQAQWPSFMDTLSRSAELCAEQLDLAGELAAQDLPGLLTAGGGLSVAGLARLSPARRGNALRHWLQGQGIHCSRVQLTALWRELALARPDATPQLRLGQKEVRRYQGALYLPEPGPAPRPLPALQAGTWQDCGAGRIRLEWTETGAELAAGLDPARLHLAFGVPGLRARPLGRTGSRPLKKLWQEYAIPPWQRERIPLLLDGDRLVAALGVFISQEYASLPDRPGWRLQWQPQDGQNH
ncbi:tRNA lysidine(34) synthetase TilS [Zobellella sp. CGMCC 1.18722]|uniref:tRNA(Ile)-lysidine synthase n=1 Tax=Zobellella iuensis TaxID=2803811 RepID=A0ABS1QWH2_9GAMM|nr:tRNA lysidine(34) synthetase TilS [Zobellella iuensis]